MMHENTSFHIDFSIQNDVLEGVKYLLSKIRPAWDVTNVVFKTFNEGISNQLLCCFPQFQDAPLLVRIYGANTELFIDREAEKRTMVRLAEAGLGPQLVATFINGLVYYYIPGSVLTVDTVKKKEIWPLVARRLGSMHRLPVTNESLLWRKMERFIELLPNDIQSNKILSSVNEPFFSSEMLRKEFLWLKSALHRQSKNPVVFCHNDLLLANIVIDEKCTEASFIDYEYAGPNFQAYDIANHFVEYAGVDTVDYSRLPSLEYQESWIREYLTSYSENPPTHKDVLTLLASVQQFTPATHFYWGLWSLVQAMHSKIDFDFAMYAKIRLGEYKRTRCYAAIDVEKL